MDKHFQKACSHGFEILSADTLSSVSAAAAAAAAAGSKSTAAAAGAESAASARRVPLDLAPVGLGQSVCCCRNRVLEQSLIGRVQDKHRAKSRGGTVRLGNCVFASRQRLDLFDVRTDQGGNVDVVKNDGIFRAASEATHSTVS